MAMTLSAKTSGVNSSEACGNIGSGKRMKP
jgi:hypothetical protein